MIRMIQSNSPAQAKKYFSEALSKADYYIGDQELQGVFHGRLAERLALTGTVTKQAFFALCENKHPFSKVPLTPRTKDNRITGYDINFHCPKSVSVLHVLSKDDHILKAFEKSVLETMQDLEKATKTRIRQNRAQDDRPTGELAWASFVHQTARPVEDNAPDPHLHSHCFVFNATWDETEKRFKAAKFRDIKRDMPYYQACFHKRLSDELAKLGYKVRATDHSFEIEGVPKEVIAHFSKRTDAIGKIAKQLGITDAKLLDELGAKTRSKKQKGMTMENLRAEWKNQIQQLDVKQNETIRHASMSINSDQKAKDCLDYAINHCFERASVVLDKRIIQTAQRFAIGNVSISVADIIAAFKEDDRLLHFDQGTRKFCTTKETLIEEKRMVELARKGIGELKPLYMAAPTFKELDGQQADAVAHVLTTADRVSIIRGGAGTGKTKLMQEAAFWIEQTGKKIIAAAPTAQAARGVLKEDGFKDAETVAKLLTDKKLQESLTNQVLWVDEAGLLGTKDMVALLELATKKQARLILGGDTRQHASVVRGDALRILNTVGNITAAEVSKIRRQKTYPYRSAVEDLSQGNVKGAFEKLDAMGAIKSGNTEEMYDALLQDYFNAVKKGKSVLVISPTHQQGDRVTEEIRYQLSQLGKLGKKELQATRLTNKNLTVAEKSDIRNYQKGQCIQFNQNVDQIQRGSLWTVSEVTDSKVTIENKEKRTRFLNLTKSARFDVFEKSDIMLSKGDQVRITRNGYDEKNRRMNNGMSLTVKAVTKKGEIFLYNKQSKTKLLVKKDFGHIAHDYCITSHASQGKTVDEVFIVQPAATFPATNLKQFYVSVSRGRYEVRLYTDDRESLLEHASEMGDRQSALELVGKRKLKTSDYIQQRHRHEYTQYTPVISQHKSKEFTRNTIDIEHEPRV